MTTRIEVALGDRSYPVLVGDAATSQLGGVLPDSARSALLVTQGPVAIAGHTERVAEALTTGGLAVTTVEVPDGEAAKSVATLVDLWTAAARVPLARGDLVVAVGGGVVGDLAGFLAATWHRGVALLQVPTTLLAQVDAAIGGKAGINLAEGKNLVGAFHQPAAVVCDTATLATLPARIRIEGLAEVVKAGLLADPVIVETLEADPSIGVDCGGAPLEDLVARAVRVKAEVVAGDEREAGPRAVLNLGHTYGHALETGSGYALLHGEAVSIGMVVALRLGVRLGRTPSALAERAERLLDVLGLPTRGPALPREEVWARMRRDKKVAPAGVRFVVLDDIGAPAVVTPDERDVDAVLDEVEDG